PGASGVRALGWVEEPELEWLYRNATVVLFPSLYEGFGFPLVETFARGVPALAADIPALREIGDGVVEFLPPLEDAAWADAVGRLAASAEARTSRREAALRRAAEFDYRRTAEETLALVHEAAGVDRLGD